MDSAPNTSPDRTPVVRVKRLDGVAATIRILQAETLGQAKRDYVPTFLSPEELAPAWMIEQVIAATDWRDYPLAEFTVNDAGWPFRALRDTQSRSRPGTEQRHGAFVLREGLYSPSMGLIERPIILPYQPIWTGLIADTIVFGGAWWVILTVPGLIRDRRRRRRGRCPTCGYTLKGLAPNAPCPECGKSLAPTNTSINTSTA